MSLKAMKWFPESYRLSPKKTSLSEWVADSRGVGLKSTTSATASATRLTVRRNEGCCMVSS